MLMTKWGEALDREHPLPEYPRPQLRRESYLNLNGIWEYAVSTVNSEPEEYDGEIVVPLRSARLCPVRRLPHAHAGRVPLVQARL